jgi:hypothetical protein
MNKNISQKIYNDAFKMASDTIWCSLKKSNSKSSSYDTFRNTGYTKTLQSPLPVEAIVHSLSPENRVLKEIGYNEFGSIEIIIKDQDINLIKNAEKITYEEEEYSLYRKGLGNRSQISKRRFGFYKVILFRTGQ